VVPKIGAMLSDPDAYKYLPRSVAYLPNERAFGRMLEQAGFTGVTRHPLAGGVAQLVTATRINIALEDSPADSVTVSHDDLASTPAVALDDAPHEAGIQVPCAEQAQERCLGVRIRNHRASRELLA
jgi:hypothetical protein